MDIAREAFARLCHVPVAWIAAGTSVSSLVSIVAAAVPDRSRVLCADREFTSVTFPFAAQRRRGVVIDEVPLDRLPERAGDYDMVVASVVQSADGALLDVDALYRGVRGTDTRVLLDVTQAAGWLELRTSWADAVVAAGYKWLLAPRGTAWMALRPELAGRLEAIGANWYAGSDRWQSIYGLPLRLATDARRFDASPAWFSQVGAAAVLPRLVALDAGDVQRHCAGLADALRAELGEPATGSAIVSVRRAGAAARLERAGIVASVRAGATRVGFHLHNDANDLDRVVDALC